MARTEPGQASSHRPKFSLVRGWLLPLLLTVGSAPVQAGDRQWSFRVFLDDKPIGTHVFTLREQEAGRELRSEASFTVKILGVTFYRYEHLSLEQWQGDCLVSMQARTNDGGTRKTVQARLEGSAMAVEANGVRELLPGCLKSFAYWNPAILSADRLLNAQTGRWEKVIIEAQGPDRLINARGQASPARRYRIVGPEQPITIWYDDANQWVGLESRVGSGRMLAYRLD